MNIIPTTSKTKPASSLPEAVHPKMQVDAALPTYTAFGGRNQKNNTGIGVILLSRGMRLSRRSMLIELAKEGFDYVVSIEIGTERYDIEELERDFPFVRFVFIKDEVNTGLAINLAARELPSPFFFILWNDLHIIYAGGASRIRQLLYMEDETGDPKRLCTVPMIQNTEFETLPTIVSPLFRNKTVETVLMSSSKEDAPTLFPFDGVGIYNREAFFRIGGFDSSIENLHWQLMDFGFRAWLWGEEIACTQFVRLTFDGEEPKRDSSVDAGYRRFFLKNLAPVIHPSPDKENAANPPMHVDLPLRRFFPYLVHSSLRPFRAWVEFKTARAWITENAAKFRRDVASIGKMWEEQPQ
jgi:hypothetical protein